MMTEYVVKTWDWERTFRLYDGADGRNCWDNIEDALLAFNSAVETNEYKLIQLVVQQVANDETIINETIIKKMEYDFSVKTKKCGINDIVNCEYCGVEYDDPLMTPIKMEDAYCFIDDVCVYEYFINYFKYMCKKCNEWKPSNYSR